MPNHYWLSEFAAGALIALILILCTLAVQSSHHEIASPDGTVPAQSEIYQVDPVEAQSSQHQDLQAQQDMAWSARIAWAIAAIVAIISLFGVIYVKKTLDATVGMLREAQTTTQISQKQLVASQRPWLKIGMKMADGLSFRDGAMETSVLFTIKNVGNYPAKNIWLDATINVHQFGSGESAEAYLNRVIENSRIKRPIPMGKFLLPGEEYSAIYNFNIPKDAMDKATHEVDFVFPKIAGCVRYDFDTSTIGHHSAFVRELFRRDRPRPIATEKNRAADVIFPDEGKIEQADLVIRDGFHSGDYAN
jgi:hypothetical protein